MKYVNKDNPDRPITPQTLLLNGEYDQEDMGLIYYDDLYNFGEEKRKEGEKNGLSRAVEAVKGVPIWLALKKSGIDVEMERSCESYQEDIIKAIELLN